MHVLAVLELMKLNLLQQYNRVTLERLLLSLASQN